MAEADQTPRRYDLLERIAVGGMAEIFRAKAYGAHGFEKTLAIKRILPDLASDAEFEDRFIGEAKLAVALTHANIVQIFDFGRFAGSLYIAMEYVDGPDLGRFLKTAAARDEIVPLSAAMHVAMEMCKGLDVAHARRVVHSDISPSNILLSRLGEVKIADFGIARAAADGAARKDAPADRVMGKWPYMSPEQTRGEPLDARSDVFSAAVVMYELFTCASLFRGRDVESIVERVRSMPIPPASTKRPSLPPALDEVLARALERDPAKRFQQASDLLRALLEVSYSHTLVATSMDVADAIRKWFPHAPEPAAAPDVDADALIREQLQGAAGGTIGGRARVTERAATPAMETPAHGVPEQSLQLGESQKTEALPGSRGRKVTFVRGEQGTDGIPVWELTIAGDPGVVPPAPPAAVTPPPSRRRAALSAALALVVAGVAAWGATRVTRAAAPTVGALRVESIPAGAQIVFDGKLLAQATPTTIDVADPTRARSLELRLPGYRPWHEAAVVLKPGEHAFYRPQLEALSTRLVVRSEPPGAEVALDGRTIGRTPISNQAVPADGATHQLRLRRHGFADATEAVQLVDGRDVVLDRTLTKVAPAPRFGTIDLHVDPWALVYLDGRKIGEAPVRGLSLPLGRHRLKLVNPVQHRQMTLAVEVPAKHAYRVKLPGR